MPIRPEDRARYPADWPEISARCIERAGFQCEKCEAPNDQLHPARGYVVRLAACHKNHRPEDVRDENLMALCQTCHLAYDRHHHRACPRTPDLFLGVA